MREGEEKDERDTKREGKGETEPEIGWEKGDRDRDKRGDRDRQRCREKVGGRESSMS